MPDVSHPIMAGTTGKSRYLEGNPPWQKPYRCAMAHPSLSSAEAKLLTSGSSSVTSHHRSLVARLARAKRSEALELSLSPPMPLATIFITTSPLLVGWRRLEKNGEVAGDRPSSHVEAVMIELVEKVTSDRHNTPPASMRRVLHIRQQSNSFVRKSPLPSLNILPLVVIGCLAATSDELVAQCCLLPGALQPRHQPRYHPAGRGSSRHP